MRAGGILKGLGLAAILALALWGGTILAQSPNASASGHPTSFGQCVAACARMGPNEMANHCGFDNFGQMVRHCQDMHELSSG